MADMASIEEKAQSFDKLRSLINRRLQVETELKTTHEAAVREIKDIDQKIERLFDEHEQQESA